MTTAIAKTKKEKINHVHELLEKMKGSFAAALPKHLTPDRLARIALTEFRKTPKLINECDPMSFIGAIMISAQLGLEPGGALGHLYLVPYGKTVNAIIGYRGMIDLARRSGQIISLTAHEVMSNDDFSYEYGLDESLKHKPTLGERGKLTHVYAVAKLVGGGHQFEVMSLEDIYGVQKQSKAGNSGPWKSHFTEMAKKTVIRKLFKYLPVSIEIQKAVTFDEAADVGTQTDHVDLPDFIDVDLETGEVIEPGKEKEAKSQADSIADKIEGKDEGTKLNKETGEYEF